MTRAVLPGHRRPGLYPALRAALVITAAGLSSCGDTVPDVSQAYHTGSVGSLLVSVMGNLGTREQPLPYNANGVPFTFGVTAQDANGNTLSSFNGYVAVSVTPGVIADLSGPGVLGNYVQLVHGVATGIHLSVAQGYGEVRIWAEDLGYIPVDPRRNPPPQCANGIDDNGNGRVDFPADPGCAAANDDSEDGGSFAAGTSEPVFFDFPLISDVNGHANTSPLVGNRVTITGRSDPAAPTPASPLHRLVVTATSSSGFYVTDIDDTSCMGMPCYNSAYAFNFNPPVGMRPCDLLSTLQGSVSDFVSFNELNQPGFQVGLLYLPPVDPAHPAPAEVCLIPEATLLTPAIVGVTASMVSLAAGLVRAENVALPTLVGPLDAPHGVPSPGATNCDLNHDGRIVYNGGLEQQCADACQTNPTCTQWSDWTKYGQIYVTLPGAGTGTAPPRILVTPKTVLPDFDPVHPIGPSATITGTLRRVGPSWIIEPRCQADIVIQNDGQTVAPARTTCLHERTTANDL